MNCRPGDLARIVGLDPRLELNDRIVRLANEAAFLYLGVAHRKLETPIEMTLKVNGHNSRTGERWFKGQDVVLHEVPDCYLRPIRDPGDDAVDEMVAKVGPAPMTLTELLRREEVSHG